MDVKIIARGPTTVFMLPRLKVESEFLQEEARSYSKKTGDFSKPHVQESVYKMVDQLPIQNGFTLVFQHQKKLNLVQKDIAVDPGKTPSSCFYLNHGEEFHI